MALLDDPTNPGGNSLLGTPLYSPNPNAPTSYGGPVTPPEPSFWDSMASLLPTRAGMRRFLTTPLVSSGGVSPTGQAAASVAVNALPGVGVSDAPSAVQEFLAARDRADLVGMATAAMKGTNAALSAIPGVGFLDRAGLSVAKEVQAVLRGERAATSVSPEARMMLRGGSYATAAEPTAARETEQLTGALAPTTPPVRGNIAQEIEQMPSQLTPKQQDTLAAARAANPQFAEASKYLTPGEIEPLVSSPQGVANFNRMLNVLPQAEQMASLSKFGAPKQGWYRASTQALIDVFGKEDAPRFASLLAATSPQNSVEMNLQNSLNIWKNWTKAGRPTDPASIKRIMGDSVAGTKGEESVLDAWYHNSVRALGAKDPLKTVLSGPKVDSFYHNLADDVYRVTNDAWMANVSGIDQGLLRQSPTDLQLARGNPGYSPGYLAMNANARKAGELIGMHPSEVQETGWSVAMPLMEMQQATGIPARELLQRQMITPNVIRGTPDFSTLLHDNPAYRGILEQAGYGEQAANLKPYQFPHETPQLTMEDYRNLDLSAKTLENLGQTRARESRAVQVPRNFNPPTTFAYQHAEAIPGLNTGVAPQLIEASPGARANFTGRVSAAQRDPQNMDIISKNLGLNTIATRPTQGVYQPQGGPVEFQRGYAVGSEVPVRYDAKGRPSLDPVDEQKIRTAAIMRAANTAQEAVPYNAQVASETGRNLFVPLKSKVGEEQMRGLLAPGTGFDLNRLAPADTGAGVNVLNFGDRPFTDKETAQIGSLLTPTSPPKLGATPAPPSVVRTAGAENPKMSYPAMPWGDVGSRDVTRMEIGSLNRLEKMAPGTIEKLDTPEFRQQAADLHKLYASQQNVRPDFLNRLDIIAKGGIPALKQAMRGKKELLPAIAGLGLTGYLLDRAGQGGTEPSAAY